jgi:hypothetical protein
LRLHGECCDSRSEMRANSQMLRLSNTSSLEKFLFGLLTKQVNTAFIAHNNKRLEHQSPTPLLPGLQTLTTLPTPRI